MSIPMKAARAFRYAGKQLLAGEEFQARGRSDARLLAAIGHAVKIEAPANLPPPVLPKRNTYQTRVLVAEAPATAVFAAPAEPVAPIEPAPEVADDLEAMDRDALHALATSMGLKPHHLTGAAKLRAMITEARAQ